MGREKESLPESAWNFTTRADTEHVYCYGRLMCGKFAALAAIGATKVEELGALYPPAHP